MHDAVTNRDISIAKTGPLLVFESRQQLEPNLAVCLVVLIDASDHGSKRLDQIRTADDANEFSVFHNRDALDPLAFEESRDLRERRFLSDRNHATGHDLADLLAVRFGEFFGERAGADHRLQPPWPTFFCTDFGTMNQI